METTLRTALRTECRVDFIDATDVCTPSHLHAPQVQQVLAAGKHAVCEKPVVGSLAEVDALIAAEARSDGRGMPVFQYRFDHGVQKLKLLIEARKKPRGIYLCQYPDPSASPSSAPA